MPSPPQNGPLGLDEARSLLAPFAQARAVLLAVSGGPDSVALMHLAAAAALADPALPPLAVATVDHGLRPGSRSEAEGVARAAGILGLPHHVLVWDGPKPTARVQERARDGRYALLAACARSVGATHLATAHTLDDQAETVLFRLMRGSGVAGLAGMSPRMDRGGLVHLRPFLGVPKDRLVAACLAHGWTFAEDPANLDPRFARSRLRGLMPALAAEGLDAPRFARLAQRMAEAEAALAQAAVRAVAEARASDERPPGEHPPDGVYAARALLALPAAVLQRALRLMLSEAARPDGPRLRRLDGLERLSAALAAAADAGLPLRRTLGGASVSFDGRDGLRVARAPPRRRDAGAAERGRPGA